MFVHVHTLCTDSGLRLSVTAHSTNTAQVSHWQCRRTYWWAAVSWLPGVRLQPQQEYMPSAHAVRQDCQQCVMSGA